MTDRQKALLSILLYCLLGGAIAAVSKIGLREIPPLSFAFIRFLLASLCIAPFFLTRHKHLFRQIKLLIPISLLATGNITFFILGIKTTTATIGQLLYAATPLLTSLIVYFIFREKLNKVKIIGLIIGLLGVLIVVLLPVIQKGESFSGDLLGNLLISLAVISWSFYMAYSKKLLTNFSPFFITSIFIFLTTIVLSPFFLVQMQTNFGWWENLSMVGIAAILYITLFGTIGTYILNQYAIKHGGSVLASLAFYLVPIFSFFWAFILLSEGLNTGIVIGGALSLLGIYLVSKK